MTEDSTGWTPISVRNAHKGDLVADADGNQYTVLDHAFGLVKIESSLFGVVSKPETMFTAALTRTTPSLPAKNGHYVDAQNWHWWHVGKYAVGVDDPDHPTRTSTIRWSVEASDPDRLPLRPAERSRR